MRARIIALLLLVTVASTFGERLNPTAYAAPNGALGPGGLQYRDNLHAGAGDRNRDGSPLSDGLGQLADGMTGCGDDPRADCGSGRGHEWVGWSDNPTIVFTFGTRCHFDSVQIFTANHSGAGVKMWDSVTISFSEDGLRFQDFTVHTTTPEDRANQTARYIRVPVRGQGRFVRIRFVRPDEKAWLLISEIQFDGSIAPHQVNPNTP
jgi:hypothetical protein